MSDWIIQFGNRLPCDVVERMLRDRPHIGDRPVVSHTMPWGSIIAQTPPTRGCAPMRTDQAVYACAGRPTFVDGSKDTAGEDWFVRDLDQRLRGDVKLQAVGNQISGMYGVVRADQRGAVVWTDPINGFPCFAAEDAHGRLAAVGTQPEIVARVAGRENDFDKVSLAELLTFNHVSFPHTTRLGMRELEPGSQYRYTAGDECVEVDHQVLWRPAEPERYLTAAQLDEMLEHAIRTASDRITQGMDRVAATLSGGKDSRVLLGVLPQDKLKATITYFSRENRESRVAKIVSEAAGLPNVRVSRDPEFFADILKRGVEISGSELTAIPYGLCILDANIQGDYDLIVYADQSDSYLKDHAMPSAIKQIVAERNPWVRLKNRIKRMAGRSTRSSGPKIAAGFEKNLSQIKPQWCEAIIERRRQYIAWLAGFRPDSAEEWSMVWPTSRMPAANNIVTNNRVLASDSLFTHRLVLEVGRQIPPELRYKGRLASRVFNRLYGSLGDIECANTGAPANATPRQLARIARKRRNNPEAQKAFGRLSPSDTPWIDVHGSWCDSELLQRHSMVWAAYRKALADSPAVEVLDELIEIDPREVIGRYDDRLAATGNWMVIQIASMMSQVADHRSTESRTGVVH